MANWNLKKLITGEDNSAKERTAHWGIQPLQFVQILKSLQYSLGNSVSDVIDNSIDIGATDIDVYFDYDINTLKSFLIVADNGKGMSEDELQSSMDLGSIRKRKADQLGKFGVGLKLSSMVQADDVTVLSKTETGEPYARRISYDYIKETKKLLLLKDIDPESNYKYIQELIENHSSGTVVLWETMNRLGLNLKTKSGRLHFDKIKIKLANHLSMTFHRFITGDNKFNKKIKISLNDKVLDPLDPLMEEFKDLQPKAAGTLSEVDHITLNNDPIRITLCIVPHSDWIKETDSWIRLNDYFNTITNGQGVYVYRNDRLISAGGWDDIIGWSKHSSKKLGRVSIDLTPHFDDIFSLEPTKTAYEFTEQFKGLLFEKVKTHRSPKWNTSGKPNPSFSDKMTFRNRNESKSGMHKKDLVQEKPQDEIITKTEQTKKTEPETKLAQEDGTVKKQEPSKEPKVDQKKTVEIKEGSFPIFTELVMETKKGNRTDVIFNKKHDLYDLFIDALKKWVSTKSS